MPALPSVNHARDWAGGMLATALGPDVRAWLAEEDVVEVMLNPDGWLWIDRLGSGLTDTGLVLGAAEGERSSPGRSIRFLRPSRSAREQVLAYP